jgi:membrane protein YqaA with SNARE-associated domain
MEQHASKRNSTDITDNTVSEDKSAKKSRTWAFTLGIIGVVATILMMVAVIYFRDEINDLQHWGYLGAFVISILGGATIIIPVPMLAVVFTLGSAMSNPWTAALLAVSAALGELIGALTIYMTGHGAGRVIAESKHGKIQRAYEKMLDLMERRGPITLFIVASVVNPFFYPAALAAGALRIGLKKYISIVLAGKLIKCATVVYAGYFGLRELLELFG